MLHDSGLSTTVFKSGHQSRGDEPLMNSMESQNQTQSEKSSATCSLWTAPRMMVTATVNSVRQNMAESIILLRMAMVIFQRMVMGRLMTAERRYQHAALTSKKHNHNKSLTQDIRKRIRHTGYHGTSPHPIYIRFTRALCKDDVQAAQRAPVFEQAQADGKTGQSDDGDEPPMDEIFGDPATQPVKEDQTAQLDGVDADLGEHDLCEYAAHGLVYVFEDGGRDWDDAAGYISHLVGVVEA